MEDTPATSAPAPPRVFISYSWTTPAHQDWVLDLARELRASWHCDVLLDKWNLVPGSDPHVFMESMAVDETITKVLIVSDCEYVRKVNVRKGGAGTEAQILTPQLYAEAGGDASPKKFAVIVREYGADGQPCVPAFYGGRLFIDMTDEGRRAEKMEEVARWAHDKNPFVPPEIGPPPSFLTGKLSTGTEGVYRRAMDALEGGRPDVLGAAERYFEVFTQNLTRFAPRLDGAARAHEGVEAAVLASAKALVTSGDEPLRVALALAQSRRGEAAHDVLRRFFAGLFVYLDYGYDPPLDLEEWQRDPFKFFVPDLFRNVVAALVRYEDYEGVAALTREGYPVPHRHGDVVRLFGSLQPGARAFGDGERFDLNRLSGRPLRIDERLQADLLLALRSRILEQRGDLYSPTWWPDLLAANARFREAALPTFARATSRRHLARLCTALSTNAEELLATIDAEKAVDYLKQARLSIARLTGRDYLGVSD